MIFNSFFFLCFFPFIFLLYNWLVSRKATSRGFSQIGNTLLLIISYALYISWKPEFALVLLWVTAVTYLSARKIEKDNAYGQKKYVIRTGVILTILPLLIFKYYKFISQQLEVCLQIIDLELNIPGLNWAIPLGISFFTFQSVGYLADVYFQRIKAEHNWWHYMLFVSFFPQIVSGPISKAVDLLPQIKSDRKFNYIQAVQGLRWILWGMFMKVVVADSIGLQVDITYYNWEQQSGCNLLLMSLLYSFQIYCDFAGYSFMAVGIGRLLGFELINNFQRPYFSTSITEFWHRWHISLSLWLKDNIYIPLGGGHCPKYRNYFNIFITFLVSGIWHGANWTYLVWGTLHGIFQIIEKTFKLNKLDSTGPIRFIKLVVTFVIVNFLWIFFRMPSLNDAWGVIVRIFTDFVGPLERPYWLIFLIFIVFLKDFLDEFHLNSLDIFHHKKAVVRWIIYLTLLFLIAVSGIYGGQFIYSGF